MQHIASDHPAGTVAFPAASLSRYAEFWMNLEALKVPTGTRLISSRGADIPFQLNECIRKMTGEWVWLLGDDHTFHPDTLLKLLDRKVDIVGPVISRRDHPFVPVLMHGPMHPTNMRRYSWSELPTTGLFQMPKGDSNGQAGMLIKRRVLGMLGDPWFEGGKLTPGRLMEDQYFIKRLHDLDLPIYIDCDVAIGHVANIDVLPQKFNGKWYAGYNVKGRPVLWEEVPTEGLYDAGS